jgi:hypothetical protein
MPPKSRITIFGNLFNGLSTTDSINFNGFNKIINNDGFNFGLKYEKPVRLNYFEISPFIGFSGALTFPSSFTDNLGNRNYPPGSTLWRGLSGLRLAVNIGPYLQVYSNIIYDFKINTSTSDSDIPGVKEKIEKSLEPKNLSYTLGVRIR